MRSLAKGAELESGDIVAPGASTGSPLVIDEPMTHFPHGIRYRGEQDGTKVLITVFDPLLVADPGNKASLLRALKSVQTIEQRSLLPLFGFARPDVGMVMVEADPGGTTVRDFVRQKLARGKAVDGETLYTLVAHVCNALAKYHEIHIHGFVTPDTVLVSTDGRVFLSTPGVGPLLAGCRDYQRYRQAGRLPNVAPEQELSPPKLTAGTDVFGTAALFLELVTGRPLERAGQPVAELGLQGPEELVQCLERACAPSNLARPPDIMAFKSELAEAVRAGPIERGVPGPPGSAATGHPPQGQAHDPSALPPIAPGLPPQHESSGVMPIPMGPYGYPPAYHGYPGYPYPPPGYPPGAVPYPPGYPYPAPPGYPPGYPPPGAGQPAPAVSPPAPAPNEGERSTPKLASPRPASRPRSEEMELDADDLEEEQPKSKKPPPPAPGSASRRALEELDAAMGKFESASKDSADSFTSLVDGSSVDVLEEDSDEGKAEKQVKGLQGKRESKRQKAARAAKKASTKPGASGSMLGLAMSYDDAVGRLSTLDGRAAADDAAGPSSSGTYFPSLAESSSAARARVDENDEDDEDDEGDEDDEETASDRRPVYFLIERGVTHGPLSLHELSKRAGNLDSGAVLQHRITGKEISARLHPALRDIVAAPKLAVPVPNRSPIRPPPPPEHRSHAMGTIVWVVLALAAFGVAGWFLYQP